MSDRFRRRGAPPPAARPTDPPAPWHVRVRRETAEIGRDISWRLRGALTWSPPAIRRSRSLPALLRTLPPDLRPAAERLAARHAPGWERACDPWGFRESLYVLDLLDRCVGPPSSPLPSLDIGCKNGCYLPGLWAWSGGPWDGVELDAHRRYWTLATRRAHGEWIARRLPGCRYLAANLLDLRGAYGFVTWFLPFLHEAPLRAWGLPRRFLQPVRLLEHVRTLLAPGGRLLVVNQGEAEAERQERLFREIGIAASPAGRIESPFSPFRRPRFGWLAILHPSD
jgi:SAM-dependent methyltransferase